MNLLPQPEPALPIGGRPVEGVRDADDVSPRAGRRGRGTGGRPATGTVPATVDDRTWAGTVQPIFDQLDALTDLQFTLAVAWCARQQKRWDVVVGINSVKTALDPAWNMRFAYARKRVPVQARWCRLNPAPRDVGGPDGLELAAYAALAYVFAPAEFATAQIGPLSAAAFDRESLPRFYDQAVRFAYAVSPDTAAAEVALVLVPE
jgi:hypothetical protein